MLLSTQTESTARVFGLTKAVEMIAAAGFDAVDLSMFDDPSNEWMYQDGYRKKIAQAHRAAEDAGVFFNQGHAPFPTMKDGDEAFNVMRRKQVLRSIEIAGMLGVRNLVVHPVYFKENKKEKNLEMYQSFLPAAEKAGVRIALENMWGHDDRRGVITKNVCSDAQELSDYVDALDSRYFTVCLDIGHVGLVGDYEAETIRALGAERLTCVHIHDNDYVHDLHTVPFAGKLPWPEICDAFSEIGYRGDLTLEADNFLKRMPQALIPAGLRFMHDAGRQLISMIENPKKENE